MSSPGSPPCRPNPLRLCSCGAPSQIVDSEERRGDPAPDQPAPVGGGIRLLPSKGGGVSQPSPPAALPSGHEVPPSRHAEPIAIVGIGCRFPGGANDPQQFWRLLTDGVD